MWLRFILLICISLLACRQEQIKDSDITQIVYRFQDSSVPPEFHRSYTITVNQKSFGFVVDSYGKIVKDTTLAIDDAKWNRTKKAIHENKIRLKNKKEAQGCTGGTTRSVTLQAGDKEIFDGESYSCGGDVYGNLAGDLDGFLKDLKEGIDPNVFTYK